VADGGGTPVVETDEYGRVLVRFLWDWTADRASAYRSGGTRSSCWLRVSQPWAGEGWGVMFTPRVGMEVLVQFVNGDPDRPLVTGCLYNGTHRPPLDGQRERTRSVIRTQSSDGSGFNELLFEDLAGSELVSLRAQRDLKVESLQNREVKVGKNDDTRVTGDAALSVDGAQRVTVKGDRTTELKARETLTVDGDLTVTVHGGAASQVAGEHQLSADEGFTARSGGSTKATLAPDGVTLKAATITVQATQTLTLRCAGSVIELSAQGVKVAAADGTSLELKPATATLKNAVGAQLALQGPQAQLSSPAMTTVQGALVKIN
jgi:type VI secretion system secreted protein VgrG